MNPDTRRKLAEVCTATLTTVLFKRGFRNTFLQGLRPLKPAAPAGRPCLHAALHPGAGRPRQLDAFEDRAHPQRVPWRHARPARCW